MSLTRESNSRLLRLQLSALIIELQRLLQCILFSSGDRSSIRINFIFFVRLLYFPFSLMYCFPSFQFFVTVLIVMTWYVFSVFILFHNLNKISFNFSLDSRHHLLVGSLHIRRGHQQFIKSLCTLSELCDSKWV